jgi:hypothetical protein
MILLITLTWIWHIILIITTQNTLFLLLKCNPLCCPLAFLHMDSTLLWMWITINFGYDLMYLFCHFHHSMLSVLFIWMLKSSWLWDVDVHITLTSAKSVDFMSGISIMFIRNIPDITPLVEPLHIWNLNNFFILITHDCCLRKLYNERVWQ